MILVTGDAGFIGAHRTRRLVRDGERVRTLDDFSSGRHIGLADVMGDVGALVARDTVGAAIS